MRERSDFWATAAPGEGETLAAKAIAAGFTTVGAAGGDGTVHEVANAILSAAKTDVALAVFPLGSANDYADAIGLRDNWWTRDDAVFTSRRVDGGIIRSGARTRYFVNGVGLGFNCAVTLEARRMRWLRGVPLYTLALLRALWSRYRAPPMQVLADEHCHDGSLLALSVGLGRREGNFVLNPRALVDDGWFDYVHVGPLARWKLISYLPRMVTGRIPYGDPHIQAGRCRSLRVMSETPLAVHADGEFFCLPEDQITSMEIELLPSALRVAMPFSTIPP